MFAGIAHSHYFYNHDPAHRDVNVYDDDEPVDCVQ